MKTDSSLYNPQRAVSIEVAPLKPRFELACETAPVWSANRKLGRQAITEMGGELKQQAQKFAVLALVRFGQVQFAAVPVAPSRQ